MAVLQIFGKGFNYSQDGPGNRLVYHLQGCNLHCPWCSNPEGMAVGGSLIRDERIQLQETSCPYGAIQGGILDRTLCTDCTRPCTRLHACGLSVSHTSVEVSALVAEVLRSRPMFFEGGGVTFTGGEATLQFPALEETLSALRAEGIHIALETNGTHPHLPRLFPLIDHLIMDVKHADPQKFTRVIGGGFEHFQNNLTLAAKRDQLALRIPLINGFNTEAEETEDLVRMISRVASPSVTVEVLRYHEYGKDKWKQIGSPYTVTDGQVKEQDYQRTCKALQNAGLKLIHT